MEKVYYTQAHSILLEFKGLQGILLDCIGMFFRNHRIIISCLFVFLGCISLADQANATDDFCIKKMAGQSSSDPIKKIRFGYKLNEFNEEVPYTSIQEAILATGQPLAYDSEGNAVRPDVYGKGYHGRRFLTPEQVIADKGILGKTPKNPSLNLKEHSFNNLDQDGHSVSLFRGVTEVPSNGRDQGAAYWADVGGYVFEIDGVPMWDVNYHLEGITRTLSGFKSLPTAGEVEYAVPSEIPIECISRWGKVIESATGALFVRSWTENKFFDLDACGRHWRIH